MKKALGIGALVLIVWAGLFGQTPPKNETAATKNENSTLPPAELTEEQKIQAAAAKAKKEADEIRWTRDVLAIRQLRKGMKNPDSFKLEEVLRMRDGTLCVTYRATNSFNAVIPGQSVITKDTILSSGADKFQQVWAKSCAGKTGEDLKSIRWAL